MKKMNKKGFTIVELVIVIAVIAILAAVLIPTFTGVVEKANQSAAMQEARNEWTNYTVENVETFGTFNGYVQSGTYYFAVENGEFKTAPVEYTPVDADKVVKTYKTEYTKEEGLTAFNKGTEYYTLNEGVYTKADAYAEGTEYYTAAEVGDTYWNIYAA